MIVVSAETKEGLVWQALELESQLLGAARNVGTVSRTRLLWENSTDFRYNFLMLNFYVFMVPKRFLLSYRLPSLM